MRGAADARVLESAGYDAVLVGETLVTAADPAGAIADLIGVPQDDRRATELWGRACTSGVPAACDAIDAGE